MGRVNLPKLVSVILVAFLVLLESSAHHPWPFSHSYKSSCGSGELSMRFFITLEMCRAV